MRILIYDDYTAGAELADTQEESQAAIHRALVAALAIDFGRLDVHDVRVASPVDTADDFAWAEATVLLAPEANDRLTDLAEAIEHQGCLLLGPTASCIRLLADRHGVLLALAEQGIPTPRSWVVAMDRRDQIDRITGRLGYPVLVRPVTGSGGRGVALISTATDLPAALDAVRSVTRDDMVQVREYAPGLAVGVGLLVGSGRALPLALWGCLLSDPPAQFIERLATPLDHPGVEDAVALATRAALAISGLRGYVEVELVLGQHGPVVTDVSGQPSLGALAVRRSRQLNLAGLITDAVVHNRLPRTEFWPPPLPVLVERADPAAALAAAPTFG